MVGSSNEISRESCQLNRQPRIDRSIAMRNVAPTRFQAPSASDQAEEENETMIADDLFTAAGSSQSLHSSVDQREPNPLRAKGGRKVECEYAQTDET